MFRVLLLILAIILAPLNLSAISFVDLQNKDNYTKVYSNQDKSVYVNKINTVIQELRLMFKVQGFLTIMVS